MRNDDEAKGGRHEQEDPGTEGGNEPKEGRKEDLRIEEEDEAKATGDSLGRVDKRGDIVPLRTSLFFFTPPKNTVRPT